MQTQLLLGTYETCGLLRRTVVWLQHRNRLHAPGVAVSSAGTTQTPLSRSFSGAQVVHPTSTHETPGRRLASAVASAASRASLAANGDQPSTGVPVAGAGAGAQSSCRAAATTVPTPAPAPTSPAPAPSPASASASDTCAASHAHNRDHDQGQVPVHPSQLHCLTPDVRLTPEVRLTPDVRLAPTPLRLPASQRSTWDGAGHATLNGKGGAAPEAGSSGASARVRQDRRLHGSAGGRSVPATGTALGIKDMTSSCGTACAGLGSHRGAAAAAAAAAVAVASSPVAADGLQSEGGKGGSACCDLGALTAANGGWQYASHVASEGSCRATSAGTPVQPIDCAVAAASGRNSSVGAGPVRPLQRPHRPAAATASQPQPHPPPHRTAPVAPNGIPGATEGGGVPVRLGSAALSSAIRNTASLEELADLYDSLYDSFRSGHVSAALSRLPHTREMGAHPKPRLVEPRHERLLAGLLGRFEECRAGGLYGTRELSACAWVLGKLGREDLAELVAELAAHMLSLHQQYLLAEEQLKPPRGLQRRSASSGGAGGRHQARQGGRSGAALAVVQGASDNEHMAGPVRQWQPTEAATTAAAAGTSTRPRSGPGFKTDSESEVWAGKMAIDLGAGVDPMAPACGHTTPCSPLDVSNMALGMAKVGVTDPGLWRQLVTTAAPQLASYGTQEVTNLAWSLAQAHRMYRREAATAATAGAGADDDSDGGSGGSGTADDGVRRPHLEQGEPSSPLTPPSWSASPPYMYSGLGAWPVCTTPRLHPDWRPWLEPWLEGVLAPLVRRTLRRFSGQQVANVAWALASLGHADSGTLAVVAAEVEQRQGRLGARKVCLLAWAMATMSLAGSCSGGGGDGHSNCSSNGNDGSSSSSSKNGKSIGIGDGDAEASSKFSGIGSPSGSGSGNRANSSTSSYSGEGGDKSTGTASHPSGTAANANANASARAQMPKPATALAPSTLRALATAAARQVHRFSPQGLSNLLWGLRVLGFRSSKRLLTLAAQAVVLQLEDLRPLGMATLLAEWAQAGLYHPGLFAAAVPAALARMGEFRPRTLTRLLTAYGTVGHGDGRLFVAAAAALLRPSRPHSTAADAWAATTGVVVSSNSTDGAGEDLDRTTSAEGPAAGGSPGGPILGATGARSGPGSGPGRPRGGVAVPLDALSCNELYHLACAYGQARVHVPRLMDSILARLAPAVTGATGPRAGADVGCGISADAACRLAAALAMLQYRPGMAAAAAAAEDSPWLQRQEPAHGQGPPAEAAEAEAALRVFRAVRRSIQSGLASLEPRMAIMGVWALMRLGAPGAPAALHLAEALSYRTARGVSSLAAAMRVVVSSPALAADPRAVARLVWVLGHSAAAAMVEAEAQRRQGQLADASQARGRGKQQPEAAPAAVAAEQLGRVLTAVCAVLVDEGLEALGEEVLVALTEGLAPVLAAMSPGGSRALNGGADGGGGGGVGRADGVVYGRLYESFVLVVEQALRRAAASGGHPPDTRFPSAGGHAGKPAASLRQRPPRLSPGSLAAIVHAMYDSGVAAEQPLMRAAAARRVLHVLQAAVYDVSIDAGGLPLDSARGAPAAPLGFRGLGLQHHTQQAPSQPPTPASWLRAEHLARLLAAAARLGLYDHPSALATLRTAARLLVQHQAGASDAHHRPITSSALHALLQHCRPTYHPSHHPGQHPIQEPGHDAATGQSARAPAGPPAAVGAGAALQGALHAWAARQWAAQRAAGRVPRADSHWRLQDGVDAVPPEGPGSLGQRAGEQPHAAAVAAGAHGTQQQALIAAGHPQSGSRPSAANYLLTPTTGPADILVGPRDGAAVELRSGCEQMAPVPYRPLALGRPLEAAQGKAAPKERERCTKAPAGAASVAAAAPGDPAGGDVGQGGLDGGDSPAVETQLPAPRAGCGHQRRGGSGQARRHGYTRKLIAGSGPCPGAAGDAFMGPSVAARAGVEVVLGRGQHEKSTGAAAVAAALGGGLQVQAGLGLDVTVVGACTAGEERHGGVLVRRPGRVAAPA